MQKEEMEALMKEPFQNEGEYVDALMQCELFRIRRYLQNEQNAQGNPEASLNRCFPDSAGIGILIEKKFRDDRGFGGIEDYANWENIIQTRWKRTVEQGNYFVFDGIMYVLGVGSFGKSVLLQALLASVDNDFRTMFSYLNGNAEKNYPNIALSMKMYFGPKTGKNLLQYRAAEMEFEGLKLLFPELFFSEEPFQENLRADASLVSVFLGRTEKIPSYLRRVWRDENQEMKPLLFREKQLEELSERLKQTIPDLNDFRTGDHSRDTLFLICGEKGSGKKSILEAAAQEQNRGILYFDVSSFGNGTDMEEKTLMLQLRIGIRNALISGDIFTVEGIQQLTGWKLHSVIDALKKYALPYLYMVILLADDPEFMPDDRSIPMTKLPSFSILQRRDIWFLAAEHLEIEGDREDALTSAANTFSFQPGQIFEAVRMAERKAEASGEKTTVESLFEVCYTQTEHELREKAERVVSGFRWEDLKLPAEEKQTLKEICYRMKYRHRVMSEWNFAEKVPYGAGTAVVFTGPPGTGKTMAAQVLANELHMAMYRIDLSQLVDKYVGETEKNIRLVFDKAKKSGSILFFDEADAIFGKRVESTDSSNDRYANIESALLLQCVEDYDGISILATNHLSAMDTAFIRRFRYVIYFQAPDAALRKEIWSSVFPISAPLAEDVDFIWLAEHFAITGAQIKNIALSAAFLAAAEGTSITLLQILQSVRKEWQKEGRKMTVADLGDYGYLYDDLII